MRIALAQTAPVPVDVTVNLRTTEQTIVAAAQRGAELSVFPELSLTGYEPEAIARTPAAWLGPDDTRLAGVRRACKATRTAAILGAPWRDREGTPRLAAIVVGTDGEIHVSAKQHLHGKEAELFVAGQPAPPFTVGGWRVAVAICFDVAHPAHAAQAAAERADLYVGSSLYMAGEDRRCDLHFGARAMDHRMFTALANYAGTTGGYTSIGGSGVWGPTGAIVQRTPDNEPTLMVVDLDRAALDAFRN